MQKKAAAYIHQAEELTRGHQLSTVTYYIYHKMLAEYYLFFSIDTRMSVYHIRRAMQRFEAERPEFHRFYERDHFHIYQTMAQAYFAMRDFRQMQWCMQRLAELLPHAASRQNRNRTERFVFRHQIMIDMAAGRYAETLAYIDSGLTAYLQVVPDEVDLSVIELVRAVCLFHLRRYEESLAALMPLLASSPPEQLPETRIEARALNLMLQYELGNVYALSDYIRGAARFFRTEKLMTKEVSLFIDLMQQLYRHGEKAPVTEYQKRLEDVYASHHFELIGHFILLPWLKMFAKRQDANKR